MLNNFFQAGASLLLLSASVLYLIALSTDVWQKLDVAPNRTQGLYSYCYDQEGVAVGCLLANNECTLDFVQPVVGTAKLGPCDTLRASMALTAIAVILTFLALLANVAYETINKGSGFLRWSCLIYAILAGACGVAATATYASDMKNNATFGASDGGAWKWGYSFLIHIIAWGLNFFSALIFFVSSSSSNAPAA